MDLAWDAIARFGGDVGYRLPRAFFDDFVAVAADECRHFALLSARLQVRAPPACTPTQAARIAAVPELACRLCNSSGAYASYPHVAGT